MSIPDDPAELEEELVAEHVGEIYFDSHSRIERECLLCQRAAATGAFARFDEVDAGGWPVDFEEGDS